MTDTPIPVCLSIAGSDSSAGAGIQQDLKTFTALGVYGATALTAVTAQNTLGVQAVEPLDPHIVRAQITAVMSDLGVQAVKIGMLPDAAVVRTVADALLAERERRPRGMPHIVCDPVMVSTSGHRLMAADAAECMVGSLFPLCTLVTPNLPEAESLWGEPLSTAAALDHAGRQLAARWGVHILVKGGHGADPDTVTDRLHSPDGTLRTFGKPRIVTPNLHGTGCTLSSAVAAFLSKGFSLHHAVAEAENFVARCIAGAKDLHIGRGNGPLRCGW